MRLHATFCPYRIHTDFHAVIVVLGLTMGHLVVGVAEASYTYLKVTLGRFRSGSLKYPFTFGYPSIMG